MFDSETVFLHFGERFNKKSLRSSTLTNLALWYPNILIFPNFRCVRYFKMVYRTAGLGRR